MGNFENPPGPFPTLLGQPRAEKAPGCAGRTAGLSGVAHTKWLTSTHTLAPKMRCTTLQAFTKSRIATLHHPIDLSYCLRFETQRPLYPIQLAH